MDTGLEHGVVCLGITKIMKRRTHHSGQAVQVTLVVRVLSFWLLVFILSYCLFCNVVLLWHNNK